jgi:hypothetical protein
MASQQVRRPLGNRKALIVGFDFGTHSTKVVLRERGKADGRIAQFDEAAEGYPPYASPSLVRYVGGRLYFGTEALRLRGGTTFGSLKVSLLAGRKEVMTSAPGGLNPTILVAAYFAWAFQKVLRSLKDYSDAKLFINVAAPMSHFENHLLKSRYLQMIQAAWNLSMAEYASPICQGARCADAVHVLASLLEEPVLGPEYRRFDVLPETIAPVVSLSLDPWTEPGIYMIVDTGAGTTEMSVFYAGEAGADQKVLCYQDETMLLGGNDLSLAEGLGHHEQLIEINRIVGRLEKQYRRLWHLGYQLENASSHLRKQWKKLTLVLSGGGTRNVRVASRLHEINPMQPWPECETRLNVCRHRPGTLDLDSDMSDDDGSMYAVANGLALDRMHWPIVFLPDQIERLAPVEEVIDKPQGYWYLDAK